MAKHEAVVGNFGRYFTNFIFREQAMKSCYDNNFQYQTYHRMGQLLIDKASSYLKDLTIGDRAETIPDYINRLDQRSLTKSIKKRDIERKLEGEELVALLFLGLAIHAIAQILASGTNGTPCFKAHLFVEEYQKAQCGDLPKDPFTIPGEEDLISTYQQMVTVAKEDPTLCDFFKPQNFSLLPKALRDYLEDSFAYIVTPLKTNIPSLLESYRIWSTYVLEREEEQTNRDFTKMALDVGGTRLEDL